ncbi:hypothetical protein BC937DRAFT_89583 [Endogone sp. FLAS-F59071]|nr:hypothetical protein BC937DRAFT_89583 [Endogone sp. FLAS-F59071]|eukprot:RUS17715.1 hypothetical protein BC937DRAFT_89583 [Endogone sp. FLAS-F59071]
MVTIPNDNRTLMDQHRPYPKRATSRSPSLPLKGKKTKPVDLITNDDVKQRVLSCFEDAVFIRCTYMSFHYKRKYSRHLDTEESDLPLLFGDKLRVMDFGQTQKYFYLATELTVQYARALPSDISSQRHSDFQIIRKRLFRLCSSPVKKYVLRSMYLYVYGAEPKFPLLHQENSGPALRFNDWSGLLNALPLMPLKSIKRMRKEELSPLWYDEADEMAPQVQIIHKRPVKERKSSKRTITVQPGHDAPKPPHTHTPLTPFTQLYYSSVNETDACRRGVVTSYSDENCPKPLCLQPPLIKAPKQFHHAIEPTSPWPLKPQTVRNFALPQPQSVQYQSHPPLSIVQPALPSRNQSLTLAQPTGEIVSSLHLTRLRIIKLFEDVMYVSVQDLSLHHYLKYGVKLDSKIVSVSTPDLALFKISKPYFL